MKEILEFLDNFINQVLILQDRLRADLRAPEGDIRLLGMGQTQAVLAHEVLGCFSRARPSHPATGLRPEVIEQEIRDRIVATLRQQFIATMSSVEFCAKEAVKMASLSPLATAIAGVQGRVYLRQIVEESRRIGLISGTDRDTWEALIEIRNMLVHNNGIADVSATYKIAGLTVVLIPGKMTETDTFLFFPKVTEEAVLKYHEWLRVLFSV